MIKETFNEYKRKKEYIKTLKEKLAISKQTNKNKKYDIYNKVISKIYKKKGLLDNIKDRFPDTGVNSNSEATAQVDGMNIPTMNDEVERVLLTTKRDKDELKSKLLQSKFLVISA